MPGMHDPILPAPPRRRFLALAFGLAGAALPVAGAEAAGNAAVHERRLRLYNCQTGEFFDDVYWAEGGGVAEALARIDWVLRDPANDRCVSMDMDLLHRLSAFQQASESTEPLEILSGFRSKETNRRLISRGASRHSQHLLGRAVDLRLTGTRPRDLYRLALSMGRGGTGYYPKQGFVHLDSGPDRNWTA